MSADATDEPSLRKEPDMTTRPATSVPTSASEHDPLPGNGSVGEGERTTSRDDRGFTLIELLIVVAILGVLGGITAFAVGNLTDRAESTACDAEKRTLSLAIESYRATRDAWPTTITQLVSAGLLDRVSTSFDLASTSSGGVVISVTPRAIAGAGCA